MKKKYLIALAVLAALTAALWWWLGGGKALQDMIPAKSKAVVRLSASTVEETAMAEQIFKLTGLPLDKAGIADEAYLYITPNEYFGAAMKVADADALINALPAKAVTEEGGVRWLWTDAGWMGALSGKTLLILGPATVQERDRLRHTLQVMLEAPAEEGFGQSDRAGALAGNAPMAFVASTSVLPAPYGTLLRLALPDTKMVIEGSTLNASDGFSVTGGALGKVHQAVEQGEVIAYQLFQATLRTDGPELLKRLRSDGTARMLLTALSDSTSAAEDISRMRGVVSLLITELDTAANPVFRLSGEDAQGKPIVLQSRKAPPASVEPLTLTEGTTAFAMTNFRVLLKQQLPEGIGEVLQQIFGGYTQAALTTNSQGDFRLTFSR